MTGTTPGACEDPAQTAGRMRATAAGSDAPMHDTRGVLDITATLPASSRQLILETAQSYRSTARLIR